MVEGYQMPFGPDDIADYLGDWFLISYRQDVDHMHVTSYMQPMQLDNYWYFPEGLELFFVRKGEPPLVLAWRQLKKLVPVVGEVA